MRLTLTIYCTTHHVEALTQTLRELFGRAHVVFIERAGKFGNSFDVMFENTVKLLALGVVTPENVMESFSDPEGEQYQYNLGLLQMICNSRREVFFEHSPFTWAEAEEAVTFSIRDAPKEIEAFVQWYETIERRSASIWRRRDENVARELARSL